MTENPYLPPPEVAPDPQPTRRWATDADVRTLRRSLIGFGIFGSVVPLLSGWLVANELEYDILPLVIGAFGFTITRYSYRQQRIPWLGLVSLSYTIAFTALAFRAYTNVNTNVFELDKWLGALPYDSHRPSVLWIPQVIWATVNAWLIFRFQRMNYGRRLFQFVD